MNCIVCGKDFPLDLKYHYISRDNAESTGILGIVKDNPEVQWYDTFDCPFCGCQNIIGERKRAVFDNQLLETDEDETEESEPQDGQISSPEDDDLADIKKKIEEAGE